MTTTTITSADGTQITYERSGGGDAVIVVTTVAEDRAGLSGLAGLLAEHFTVYSYDRRARGDSGDTQPYAPEREVEDLATAPGDRITRLYLFEPPFIVNDGDRRCRPTTSSMSNRWWRPEIGRARSSAS